MMQQAVESPGRRLDARDRVARTLLRSRRGPRAAGGALAGSRCSSSRRRPPPPSVQEHLSAYLEVAASLGRRTRRDASRACHRLRRCRVRGRTASPARTAPALAAPRAGAGRAHAAARSRPRSTPAASGRPRTSTRGPNPARSPRARCCRRCGSDLSGLGASAKIRIHGDYRLGAGAAAPKAISTSRASRAISPGRPPRCARSSRRCATSPACCARSATPRTRR